MQCPEESPPAFYGPQLPCLGPFPVLLRLSDICFGNTGPQEECGSLWKGFLWSRVFSLLRSCSGSRAGPHTLLWVLWDVCGCGDSTAKRALSQLCLLEGAGLLPCFILLSKDVLFELCPFPIDELSVSGPGAMLGTTSTVILAAFTADNLGLLSNPCHKVSCSSTRHQMCCAGQGLLLAMTEAGIQKPSSY